MASLVSNYGYFAKFGFNMLVSRLGTNATVQMSAYDYLWGYNEPLINVGNTVLPGWINFETLGLLDRVRSSILINLNTDYDCVLAVR